MSSTETEPLTAYGTAILFLKELPARVNCAERPAYKVAFSTWGGLGMVRALYEELFFKRRTQESAMRKEALRLIAALLPVVFWVSAPPSNVFA